ncbi:Hypothetical predicted protein [Olea europaea subsp. europaea]|uniref:Uncharacterized protein n=1 Tax=Olea europaea subsp. europaea TaxID=158383 RepID=A0A8S0T4Y7_OLEEU|nr:Hypothetical predicted protein [Olea europaea subsp. europaea]
MPEIQVASLSRPGRVPNMASTPCPETVEKCLKIRVFLVCLALSRISQANYHYFQSKGAIVGYVALVEYDVKNLGIPLDTTVSKDAKIVQVLWTSPMIMQMSKEEVDSELKKLEKLEEEGLLFS